MASNIKQVVILSGGKGTRMRELTESLPKPMVDIGGMPVLDHLINIFSEFNQFEFLICGGYKYELIENHFKTVSNVSVINTGLETNTGGRLYKIRELLDNNFIVTYGDGLANVNINSLINFHFQHNNTGTVTVTNPTSRFGLVDFDSNFLIKKFIEKQNWMDLSIWDLWYSRVVMDFLHDNSVLESEPLMKLTEVNQLRAFVHDGYFEPMDTYREYLNLNKLWDTGEKPWTKF